MSRNSKNNRKRKAKKKAQYEKRRQAADSGQALSATDFFGIDTGSSAADYFGSGAVVTVNVLRPASGKHYAEHDLIPLDDREMLEVIEQVPIGEVDALAENLKKKIEEGEYPPDARITTMGQPTFHSF